MKKLFYLMACCLLGGLFWQCKDDEKSEGPYTFKIPIENYTAPQAGGKKLVEFTTADLWTAKVNYAKPLAPGETDWCTITPLGGGVGVHTLTIELTDNMPYDDREAEIVITSGGQTKTLKLLQTNVSGIVCQEPTQNLDYKGGMATFNISANCEYDVEIPEEVKNWVTIVMPANTSKAMVDQTLTVKATPNDGFGDRTATITLVEKGDVSSDLAKLRIRLVQTSLDEKYLIANNGSAAASVIKNSDGSMDAFYLYNFADAPTGKINGFTELSWHNPLDMSTATPAQKITLNAPFSDVKILGCTWGNDTEGGGDVNMDVYLWDENYATTVAQAPVYTSLTKYTDGAWASLMSDGTILPPGTYLFVLKGQHLHTGVWYVDQNANGSESFLDGEATTKTVMKTEFVFTDDVAARAANSGMLARSTDNGHTWTPVAPMIQVVMNNEWLKNAPSQMSVAKCGNYYFATFDKGDNHVYVARSSAAKGPWKTWNGAGWGSVAGKSVVDTTSAASLVERNGTVYAYYVKRNRVYVATAASSENWPDNLAEKGMAYKIPEEGTITNVSAKFHADINKFVVLYTFKRETLSLVSDDGLTFTKGTIGVNPVPDDTYGVQYMMDASGVVTGGDQYFSYGLGSNLYFRPKVK